MNLIELAENANVIVRNPFVDDTGNMCLESSRDETANLTVSSLLDRAILKEDGQWIGVFQIDDYYTITADQLKDINKVDIQINKEQCNWSSVARRPYYEVIGKPVTEDQAFELIRRTDSCFCYDLEMDSQHKSKDYIRLINLDSRGVRSNGTFHGGWIHKNGRIEGSGMTTKYPDAMELIFDAYLLASNFPYLDVVIAVTSWDEKPYNKKIEDWYDNPTLKQVVSNIAIGVHIKDGNISILEKSDAAALYKSYKKQYGKRKTKSDNKPVMDIEYFEKLVKANNLEREDFINCI